jgi:replicative DNA helicase
MSTALPSDVDLELSILGGILIRPDVLRTLAAEADDFYDPRCRAVFGAMRNLEARGVAVDIVLVGDELEKEGKLEPIGGQAFLGECALRVPTPDSVHHYAAALRQHRISRQAALDLAEIVLEIRQRKVAGSDVIARIRGVHDSLAGSQPTVTKITMGEAARQVMEQAVKMHDLRAAGVDVHPGVQTGLKKLDELLGGIPRGVLTLIAGRPGNGKTTLMQTIARHVALSSDAPLFYSYEDSNESFGQREIASATGVATHRLRALDFHHGEWSRVQQESPRVFRRRTWLVQSSGLAVEKLCADVRRERQQAKERGERCGGLVLVDYLQRMPTSGKAEYHHELGRICNALVDLAATEGIAVVAGSQLNRNLENRESKVPQLSDLRDSGRLEELSKVVLAVYREGKYVPSADPNELQVHILKNHQGETGCFARLRWNLETHSITDHHDTRRR